MKTSASERKSFQTNVVERAISHRKVQTPSSQINLFISYSIFI